MTTISDQTFSLFLPMPLTNDQHRELAASLFNHVWTRMEQDERSPEDVDDMIAAAHASLYHWMQCGTAVNIVRGHWQIARMYAVLKWGTESMRHAQRCLDVCQANAIGDFDLAYAFEAMARACWLVNDIPQAQSWYQQMTHAAANIAKAEDAAWFAKDTGDLAGLAAQRE